MSSSPQRPPRVPIMQESGFELAFAKYTQGKAGKLISSFLNEKRNTLKDTDQSYRIINHWSTLGLLEDHREKVGQWRKLSILDILWIQVLAKMRKFGFPLEKMRTMQRSLFRSPAKGVRCAFFEFALAQIIVYQEEQYLVVLEDGKAAAISGEMLDVNHRFSNIEHYICINLSSIVSTFFEGGKDFSPAFRNVATLNEDEADMLLQMRSGAYESVNVRMKDGKIEMIEATETIEAQRKLVDILKEADYQSIEVKTRDGKIASIKRTVKKKPASKATGSPRASLSTEPLRSSGEPTSEAVPSNAHG